MSRNKTSRGRPAGSVPRPGAEQSPSIRTQPSNDVSLVWSLSVGLAFLLIYLLMAPPFSGDKDASEFTLALAYGGVPHPTGYPLFIACGHLFVRALHALGAGWAFAANAWSAVGGAVAVGLLHALALRLIPPVARLGPASRAAVGLLPAVLFGLNPLWTYETTLAEVYSWHVAWVAGCCLVFVGLMRALSDEAAQWTRARGDRLAFGWGLLCGLGGAHHTTALLVAAPLSLVLFWRGLTRHRAGARQALLVLAAALLPLLAYGFVAWRAFHPALWQWPTLQPSWESIVDHLLATPYRKFLGNFAPSDEQQPYLAKYIYPYLLLALAVVAGTLALARRSGERAVFGALGAAGLLAAGYAFSYGVPDPSSYFLAPLAIGLACLPALLVGLAKRGSGRMVWTAGLLLAIGASVLAYGWIDVGLDRRRTFVAFEQRVHSMWESITFDRAIVLWNSDMYTRLLEYQLLRGEKPGVEVLSPRMLTHDAQRAQFRERHGFDPQREVALTNEDWRRADGEREASQRVTETLARSLNAQSPLPVVIFDPERDSVRMLRKR